MGVALGAAMGAIAFVAEHAAEVVGNVGAAVTAFRIASLELERGHRAPRSAAVWRHFRCAPWNVSEK